MLSPSPDPKRIVARHMPAIVNRRNRRCHELCVSGLQSGVTGSCYTDTIRMRLQLNYRINNAALTSSLPSASPASLSRERGADSITKQRLWLYRLLVAGEKTCRRIFWFCCKYFSTIKDVGEQAGANAL